ncbi:delta-1-pyrroline-5-carboxylate synthase 1-like [Zingiber officinale]|uniref:delta-1-pyrroline-5-carboxylate synthase 1-like n=1 Tax=Zingiber officinale TaxID=94328 RepID=UPI001C4C235C|nr:delta-1-pyrroline-5-carboxylate synthase 1-like [Zingiber officinale]
MLLKGGKQARCSNIILHKMEMARHIIVVSKLDYLATYNAMETLLIHHDLSNNHSFEELVLELKHEGVLKGTGNNIRKPKKYTSAG